MTSRTADIAAFSAFFAAGKSELSRLTDGEGHLELGEYVPADRFVEMGDGLIHDLLCSLGLREVCKSLLFKTAGQ